MSSGPRWGQPWGRLVSRDSPSPGVAPEARMPSRPSPTSAPERGGAPLLLPQRPRLGVPEGPQLRPGAPLASLPLSWDLRHALRASGERVSAAPSWLWDASHSQGRDQGSSSGERSQRRGRPQGLSLYGMHRPRLRRQLRSHLSSAAIRAPMCAERRGPGGPAGGVTKPTPNPGV